jgi:hypothetical protein
MRLSKVKPGIASATVAKAVAGGLMQSVDDNAVIRHTANFVNDIGSQLNGGQSAFFYLAEDFVSYLKSNNDPRLASIAVRYIGAGSGASQTESRANRTPAVQVGMPLGYDNTTISSQGYCPGACEFMGFQPARPYTYGKPPGTQFLSNLRTNTVTAGRSGKPWLDYR